MDGTAVLFPANLGRVPACISASYGVSLCLTQCCSVFKYVELYQFIVRCTLLPKLCELFCNVLYCTVLLCPVPYICVSYNAYS